MWLPSRRQGNLHGLARAVQQSARPAMEQVRECSHWPAHVGCPTPCLHAQTKPVSAAPTPTVGGAGHSCHGHVNFAAHSLFRTLSDFAAISMPISCTTCASSRETEDSQFILGADLNFPPSLWQDSSLRGGSLWIQKLGASVVTQLVPHTRAALVGV